MPLLALCAVSVLLSVVGLTGCSAGGESSAADKVGALGGVVVLQLGDPDTQDAGDLPVLTYFADRVEELSDGALRVDTTYAAAGPDRPDAEQEVARMVRDGKLDLGYVGAQSWDELGVKSFAGLFAPLLVDDDALLNAVAQDRLAAEMLGGLRRAGVVGLALVPRSLGPPVGLEHPFVNPDDFAGSRVAVTPSRTADAALRALRARPVHLSGPAAGDAVAAGRVDAQLPAFDLLPVAGVVAANVSLLPKLNTLFVNSDSLQELTDDQRLALRAAASRTVAHVIATRPTAQAALERFCSIGRGASPTGGGRAVLAGASDLDALVRATRPVYAELRRDPRARDAIARIRSLKAVPPASSGPPSASGLLHPESRSSRRRHLSPAERAERHLPLATHGSRRICLRPGR